VPQEAAQGGFCFDCIAKRTLRLPADYRPLLENGVPIFKLSDYILKYNRIKVNETSPGCETPHSPANRLSPMPFSSQCGILRLAQNDIK
jgi:hypothetical protein